MRVGMKVLLCAALVAGCGSSSGGETFHASMSAAQEIPAPNVNTPAPSGTAVFTNNGDGTVSYTVTGQNTTVTATGVTPANNYSGMHIHLATVGNTAGVTVPLTTPANGSTSFTVTGTFTSATCGTGQVNCINSPSTMDTVLNAMRNGGAYINVHTNPRNPPGEMRGQIATGGL
jgi:CHRD domain